MIAVVFSSIIFNENRTRSRLDTVECADPRVKCPTTHGVKKNHCTITNEKQGVLLLTISVKVKFRIKAENVLCIGYTNIHSNVLRLKNREKNQLDQLDVSFSGKKIQ